MIRHTYVYAGCPVPSAQGVLYEYLTGSNGVFLHAIRPGLEVLFPLGPTSHPIRGLAPLQPRFQFPKIPAALLARMLHEARTQAPYETLFYLQWQGKWVCEMPEQRQTRISVVPTNPHDPAYQKALVEVHSHPPGSQAYFSSLDNRSEQLFRIYVVLGRLEQACPEIAVRVGVYGQFFRLPPKWIFGP